MEAEDLILPKYYRVTDGLELQDLLALLTKDLNGVEAVNIGSVIKYIIRYGKKHPTPQGKLETLDKMINYLVLTKIQIEKEIKSPTIMPSEWEDDPLHDED